MIRCRNPGVDEHIACSSFHAYLTINRFPDRDRLVAILYTTHRGVLWVPKRETQDQTIFHVGVDSGRVGERRALP